MVLEVNCLDLEKKTALIRATIIYRGIRRLSFHLEHMLSNPFLEFELMDLWQSTDRNFRYQ